MKRQKPSWLLTNVPWETKKTIWKLWESGVTISGTLAYLEENPQEHPVYSRHTIGRVREELMKLPVSKFIQLLSELPGIEAFVKELRPDYIKQELHEEEQRAQYSSELTTTALIIASNLEKIRNAPPASLGDPFGHTIYKVEEKVYGGWWVNEDRARLGNVNRKVAAALLKRLKEEGEFPELAEIEDWEELREIVVTEDFIQKLISRAHRGNF